MHYSAFSQTDQSPILIGELMPAPVPLPAAS